MVDTISPQVRRRLEQLLRDHHQAQKDIFSYPDRLDRHYPGQDYIPVPVPFAARKRKMSRR